MWAPWRVQGRRQRKEGRVGFTINWVPIVVSHDGDKFFSQATNWNPHRIAGTINAHTRTLEARPGDVEDLGSSYSIVYIEPMRVIAMSIRTMTRRRLDKRFDEALTQES